MAALSKYVKQRIVSLKERGLTNREVVQRFQLHSNRPCCVRNPEGLRTQPIRLYTCGRSTHVYINCAIAWVLVVVNCEAKAGLV